MPISTPKIPRKYFPLVIVFAVLVLLMPRTAKFNYDYKKGTPWPYETLISQFDFPILKTEEQMQEEREASGSIIIPYYRYSEEVTSSVVRNVQSLDLGRYNSMRPTLVTRLGEIYSKGVISDGKVKWERGPEEVSENLIFIQRNKRAGALGRLFRQFYSGGDHLIAAPVRAGQLAAVGPEGIGVNDLASGIQIRPMNGSDPVGPGKIQQFRHGSRLHAHFL